MNKLFSILILYLLVLTGCMNSKGNLSVIVSSQYEFDAGYGLALKELKNALEKKGIERSY